MVWDPEKLEFQVFKGAYETPAIQGKVATERMVGDLAWVETLPRIDEADKVAHEKRVGRRIDCYV